MGATSSEFLRRPADAAARQVRIFINYRRDDTKAEARLLYERLAKRFGDENVFLDKSGISAGTRWLDEIKSHIDSCHIFLSLIGLRWLSIMRARELEAIVDPAEDYVRFEIQRALKSNSGISVIPVLVEDNAPYEAEELPGSLQALAKLQAAHFRCDSLESDTELLISRIETIAREQAASPAKPATAVEGDGRPASVPAGTGSVVSPADAPHCDLVLKHMVDEGNLVLFLGPQMGAGYSSTVAGPPSLLDAEKLAAALAARFDIKGQARLDLPAIAQHIYVIMGRADLWRALKQFTGADCEPGPVHRFLAGLPRMLKDRLLKDAQLKDMRHPKRHQFIVSTNFDTALEQAFKGEQEPYDLAVYMASGQDKGKFVHFPYDGPPKAIAKPNSYAGFPIGIDGELWRTVIVKIHGAVDGKIHDYRWQENYIITEDHYIDYLSNSPIESLVPIQILDKLKNSHCLFLGYTVSDWNLRVFLKRIWEGSPGAKSWAIEPGPDVLEKCIWAQSYVDLYASDLAAYVDMLQARLEARLEEQTPGSAGP